MTDHPELTALLGSRICHDLISPIGAIGNGLELLMIEGATRGPEMALIAQSVAAANARIRFFRVAFGLSSDDQRLGRPEVVSILSDLTAGGRVSIDWQLPSDLLRREAKLIFLAILCVESAMAFGGRITITQDGGRYSISGKAARLKIDVGVWEHLSNPTASVELTPALVHFALLPAELPRQKRRLAVEIRETEIRLAL